MEELESMFENSKTANGNTNAIAANVRSKYRRIFLYLWREIIGIIIIILTQSFDANRVWISIHIRGQGYALHFLDGHVGQTRRIVLYNEHTFSSRALRYSERGSDVNVAQPGYARRYGREGDLARRRLPFVFEFRRDLIPRKRERDSEGFYR